MNDPNIKYMTPQQVIKDPKYPFKKGQLMSFLLFRNENGLNKAVIKIGKCIYIKSDLFDRWIEEHLEVREILK